MIRILEYRLASALAALCCLTIACKPSRESTPDKPTEITTDPSETLLHNFPVLPLIEKSLWPQLIAAEHRRTNSKDQETRETADREVARLASLIQSRHPFTSHEESTMLGGITFDHSTQRIRIPAKAAYPVNPDDRHPNEIELMLCTDVGRLHETLFVADIRPLHLELLLHLTGHSKRSTFRIEAVTEDGIRIPIESLVERTDGGAIEDPLAWEFSGSDYQEIYQPDLSGDLAIFWHSHESVLRVSHTGIAHGEIKLAMRPKPSLPNGTRVTLELIRVD